MICPGCESVFNDATTFCWSCKEYIADMLLHSEEERRPRPADAIPDDRPEDEIQEAGRKALELLGFKVYSLNQDRATRQTPGIADTYVAGHGRTTWAEWKRPGEDQSPDQVDFNIDVVGNGAEYHVWRHEAEAISWAEYAIASERARA